MIVCGNCRYYGYEFPENNVSWAYCKKWKRHFPKNIVKMPCYNTCPDFEKSSFDTEQAFTPI